MGLLQFHQSQYRHQHQTFMTPISFPRNLRAATTMLCFRPILTKWFSTSSSPKLLTSRCGKIRAISRVSADELKERWLNSLNCAPLIKENDEDCGNGETVSNNHDSQWVIGIDPDVSGALALLKPYDLGVSAQVYDSPSVKVLIGNSIRRRMDTKAMVELLRSLSIPTGTTAYIEQSLPSPGDGKLGWWSGGFNYGLWIGVLVASGVSVVPVASIRWKKDYKLSGKGKTKDDSIKLACSLFPSLSSSLKRKKDHGRAEALLIAAYGKGIRINSDSESLISIESEDTTL